MGEIEHSRIGVDLPEWFYARSELSMDPLKGPDEQYRAGARDMWALVGRQHKEIVGAGQTLADAVWNVMEDDAFPAALRPGLEEAWAIYVNQWGR